MDNERANRIQKRRWIANLPMLSDEDLADLVEARDAHALDELERRYFTLADQVARRLCGPLSHRGAACPGWSGERREGCDGAYPLNEILDHFVGHVPGECRRGKTQARNRKSLFVAWKHRNNRALDFPAFVRANSAGWEDNALRVWNAARGLKAKLRFTDKADEGVSEGKVGELFVALSRHDPTFRSDLGVLALAPTPGDAMIVLDTIWRDACQPAGSAIDADRVTRRLTNSGELSGNDPEAAADAARAALEVTTRFDEALAAAFPEWYGTYLDGPRQQTRAHSPLLPDGAQHDSHDLEQVLEAVLVA